MGKKNYKKPSGRPTSGKGLPQKKDDKRLAPTADAAGEKKSLFKNARFILIAVCALLLVAIGIVTGVLIFKYTHKVENFSAANQATAYNYEKLKVEKYLDLSSDFYKGVTVDMKAYYDKYVAENDLVHMEIDDAFVDENISYQLMTVRKPVNQSGAATVNGTIGYGDDVSFFVLAVRAVDENGNTLLDDAGKERVVPADIFVNAYQAVRSVTIGAYTYGEALDRALIGLNPADTRYSQNSEVDIKDIAADAVITFSYTATIDGKTAAYKTVSGQRVDLGAEENEIVALMLANGKDLRTGETISFSREEDINEDGKKEKVNYEGSITAVVEEKSTIVKAALPEDYFSGEEYEKYTWLNGVTLEYTMIITGFTDYTCYEAKDLTVKLIKEDLGYKDLKATEDAAAAAEYRKYVKEQLIAEKEASVKKYKQSALILKLFEAVKMKKVPQKAFDLNYAAAMEALEQEYLNYQYYYPGTYATMEEFAQETFRYSEEDYPTVESYMEEMARQEVFYNLLLVGVMDLEGLEPTEEEEKAAYEAIIEETIANAAANGSTISRETAIASYSPDMNDPEEGEKVLRVSARKRAMGDRVIDFLLEKNTFTFEK